MVGRGGGWEGGGELGDDVMPTWLKVGTANQHEVTGVGIYSKLYIRPLPAHSHPATAFPGTGMPSDVLIIDAGAKDICAHYVAQYCTSCSDWLIVVPKPHSSSLISLISH